MISSVVEAGGAGSAIATTRPESNDANARLRRQEAAYAELLAMSTEDRAVCDAPASHPRRSLGSSIGHTSPKDLYPTLFHAFVHSPEAEALNQKLHGEFLDAAVERDKKRRVRMHYEGSLIRIDGIPGWSEYENEKKSKRGAVKGFSTKARSRMLQLVASLKAKVLPHFVTLTYPREWENDPRAWKTDLDTFGKWLQRAYPTASFIWKLEPQQRGAPHFHLLVFGIAFLPWQIVAMRWAEIVNRRKLPQSFPVERGKYGALIFHEWVCCNIDDHAVIDHIRAGVKVEAIRSRNGVMRYCGKNYMGKECELPEGWEKVGRFWGIVGRKNLPRSAVIRLDLSRDALVRVRRTVRRWFAAKGIKRRGGRTLTLFTSAHSQWLRVLELAETGATEPQNWVIAAAVSRYPTDSPVCSAGTVSS